jgi:hypothetical protein
MAWLRGLLPLVILAGCHDARRQARDRTDRGPADPFVVVHPASIGIGFVNRIEDACEYRLPDITGSGIALADLDGDERLDLVVASLSGSVAILMQSEDGGFDDRGREPLLMKGVPMGIAIGDLNNDSFPEILVTAHGDDRLFLNEGDGRFRDVTEAAGYANPAWGTTACFLDYDRDGWLDLFVTNYVDYRHRPCSRAGGGPRDFCGPHLFDPTIDRLFRNVAGEAGGGGSGDHALPAANDTRRLVLPQLVDVTGRSGIAAVRGAGLGATACDLTGDALPDIYVANDQMANALWVNRGDGTFQDEATLRGCAHDLQGRPQGSMGIAVDDFDSDGHWDIVVTHLGGEYHTLYRGHAGGTFTDDTAASGLVRPTLPLTGFGIGAVDLDHDGDADLVAVSGAVRRPGASSGAIDRISATPTDCLAAYREPGQVLWNSGGAFLPAACGAEGICRPAVARGLAVGDIDGDGDQDIVVNCTGSPPLILRNEHPGSGHWVRVRATLPQAGGRDAIGAVVSVVTAKRVHRRLVQPGMGYLGTNDARAHVGLGSVDRIERLDVTWPDGSRSSHLGGGVDRDYFVAQPLPTTP